MTYPASSFYLAKHKGDLYFGLGGQFVVIPGVDNPVDFVRYVYRRNIENALNQYYFGWRLIIHWLGKSGDFRNSSTCRTTQVHFDVQALNALFSIHANCQGKRSFWTIQSSPVAYDWNNAPLPSSDKTPDPFRLLRQVFLFKNLHSLHLEPFQNSNTSDKTLKVLACKTVDKCHTIYVKFTLDDDKSAGWLIHHLHDRSSLNQPVLSVLDENILLATVHATDCLFEQDTPKCSGVSWLNGEPTYTVPSSKTAHPRNWLYHGKGLSLLPLSYCSQTALLSLQQCPYYLLWSEDYSQSTELVSPPTPVLSLRSSQHLTDYEMTYKKYDFPGVGQGFISANPARELMSAISNALILFIEFAPQSPPVNPGALAPASHGLLPAASIQKVIELKQPIAWNPVTEPYTPPIVTLSDRQTNRGAINLATGQQENSRANSPATIQQIIRSSQRRQGDNNGGGRRPPRHTRSLKSYSQPAPADLNDLIQQLEGAGLYPGTEPNFFALNLLAEKGAVDPVTLMAYQRQIETQRSQLNPLLRVNAGTVFEELKGRFNPWRRAHLILFSELAGQDVIAFMASAPGRHRVLIYRHGEQSYSTHDLSTIDLSLNENTLYLAFSEQEGALRLHPLTFQPQARPLLVTGVDDIMDRTQQRLHEMGLMLDAHQYLINLSTASYDLNAEHVQAKAKEQLVWSGLAGWKPSDSAQAREVLFSKTLVEAMEFFWDQHLTQLTQDGRIIFTEDHALLIRKAKDIATELRTRKDRFQLEESELSIIPTSTTDIPIPLFVQFPILLALDLIDIQRTLAESLSRTLSQLPPDQAAVYGGAATRTHLVNEVFAGDLGRAITAGLPSMNDIDLMVKRPELIDAIATQFTQAVSEVLPEVKVVVDDLPIVSEHVTAKRIKVKYGWSKLFIVDMSYSSDPQYYDFKGVSTLPLPAYGGTTPIIFPMIGLKALIDVVVKENTKGFEGDGNEERKKKSELYLKLFSTPGTMSAALVAQSKTQQKAKDERREVTQKTDTIELPNESQSLDSKSSDKDSTSTSQTPPLNSQPSTPEPPQTKEKKSAHRKKQKSVKAAPKKELAFEIEFELPKTEVKVEEAPSTVQDEKRSQHSQPKKQTQKKGKGRKKDKKISSPEPEHPIKKKEIAAPVKKTLQVEHAGPTPLKCTPVSLMMTVAVETELNIRTRYPTHPEPETATAIDTTEEKKVTKKKKKKKKKKRSELKPTEEEHDGATSDEGEAPLLTSTPNPRGPKWITQLSDLTLEEHDKALVGWASFNADLNTPWSPNLANVVELLQTLEATSMKTEQKILIHVDQHKLVEHQYQVRRYHFLPEIGFLLARSFSWGIDNPHIFTLLHEARFFHQAFPYLANILGNPDSPFFEPRTLIKAARESRVARHPALREYHVANAPEWPDPSSDKHINRIVELLKLSDSENTQLVKEYKDEFLTGMERGEFHAGLAMVLLELKAFNADEKMKLHYLSNSLFSKYPGAYWLMTTFEEQNKENIADWLDMQKTKRIHYYFHLGLTLKFWQWDITAVDHFRLSYDDFADIYKRYPSDVDERLESLIPELMSFESRIYMTSKWYEDHLNKIQTYQITGVENHDYQRLVRMLLSAEYHIDKIFLLSSSAKRVFHKLEVKRRSALFTNHVTFDPEEDIRFISTSYIRRLRSAYLVTKDPHYLELVKAFKLEYKRYTDKPFPHSAELEWVPQATKR